MLEASDIHFAYRRGQPILDGVSVTVPGGAFTGILGPNGSGKTTLLRILAGSLEPDRGSISLDGAPLRSIPRARIARRMAVVPQETHLVFDYSVLEVVLMGRYPHLRAFEIEGPADVEIARDALRATGTLPLQDRPFATLSGGEKQRVIIASALAQIRPQAAPAAAASTAPVLLLDEPTTALDLGYLLDTAGLLRDLQRELSLTIVISTHDLNFAASVCRDVVLLRAGRVTAAGRTNDVLTPSNIRSLYGVDADVRDHPAAGHLVVVPLPRQRKEEQR